MNDVDALLIAFKIHVSPTVYEKVSEIRSSFPMLLISWVFLSHT